MANVIKSRLGEIFGGRVPEKTTNFHTVGNKAVFVVTDVKKSPPTKYVEVEMSASQIESLRDYKMLGSFGWSLQ